ncbi:MAG: uracil phosphoribosyltransferase [Fimbriimonadaceae bacterium]|nr:uracil phosphoribosyltransferase [Fimbriimonadaceae bacterium]QYK57219.1 MAG: uracil phosphoribosyltransferase [Fimbriimonadaceae bacterium]
MITVVDHPLAQHLLTNLRDAATPPHEFRQLARTLSTLVVLEATRGISLEEREVATPVAQSLGHRLAAPLAVVPVLRAGLSMLEPVLELFPDVAVGYIGLERSHETAVAHSYYCKLPRLQGRTTLLLDPMLATGGSASQAAQALRSHGAERVVFVSIVSAPEGVERMRRDHPDVPIFTAAVDQGLNDQKYIVPGLGDYGDRLYGTP